MARNVTSTSTEVMQDLGEISGNVVIDLSLGTVIFFEVVGPITNLSITGNTAINQSIGFTMVIKNGADFSVAFDNNIKFNKGIAPQLTGFNGEEDILVGFLAPGKGVYLGIVAGNML